MYTLRKALTLMSVLSTLGLFACASETDDQVNVSADGHVLRPDNVCGDAKFDAVFAACETKCKGKGGSLGLGPGHPDGASCAMDARCDCGNGEHLYNPLEPAAAEPGAAANADPKKDMADNACAVTQGPLATDECKVTTWNLALSTLAKYPMTTELITWGLKSNAPSNFDLAREPFTKAILEEPNIKMEIRLLIASMTTLSGPFSSRSANKAVSWTNADLKLGLGAVGGNDNSAVEIRVEKDCNGFIGCGTLIGPFSDRYHYHVTLIVKDRMPAGNGGFVIPPDMGPTFELLGNDQTKRAVLDKLQTFHIEGKWELELNEDGSPYQG